METKTSCLETRISESGISSNLVRALYKTVSIGMERDIREMAEELNQHTV